MTHRNTPTTIRPNRSIAIAALIAAVVPILGNSNHTFAQINKTWSPPAVPDTSNQFWDISSRWSPVGAPSSIDNAIFASTGSYEIHFDSVTGSPTINNLTNSSGSPTFRRVGTGGSNIALNVNGISTYSNAGTTIVIGESESRRLTLNHVGTTTITGRNLVVSSFGGTTFSTVNVGSGTSVGALITNSASANINATSINAGSTGGNRSTLDFTGSITSGNIRVASSSSETFANARFGSSNISSTTLLVGNNFNSDGILTIDDNATVNNSTTMILGFNTSTAGQGYVFSTGNLTTNSLTLFGNGSLDIGGGSFTVGAGGLNNRGNIRLAGGTFSFLANSTPSLGGDLGNFEFISGTARRTSLSNANNSRSGGTSIGWLFGNNAQIITPFRRVELANVLDLVEPLQLDGGFLKLSGITNPSLLDFRSGELRFNSSTSIGLTTALGSFVDLKPNSTISTEVGTLTVTSNATVIVRDGASLKPDDALFINGTVALDGIAARLAPRTGPVNIINGAVLRGQGIVGSDTLTSTQNAGIIELTSSDLRFTGILFNGTNAIIQGRGQLVAPVIVNDGRMNFSGGFTDIYATLDNSATGRIVVSGGGVLSLFGTVTHPTGADIRTGTGSRTVFLAPVSGAGSFSGTGLVQFESAYSPGSSPGLINFAGDLELIDPAQLNIELAGTARGSQYDALNVNATASLAGTLNLQLISGYIPAYGSLHRIISAASLSGRFDQVLGFSIDPNRRLAVRYQAGNVDVIAALPGDADINGSVNFTDLLALARNYNQSNRTWTEGDFDYDSIVGFTDLLALARNYGQSISSQELASLHHALGDAHAAAFSADWALALSVIPEPTTLTLLTLPTMLLMRKRSRPSSPHHFPARSTQARA